jgi:tetratricopeptide (TPR) repeat protein
MWDHLNNEFAKNFHIGAYEMAYSFAVRALQYAEDEFGEDDAHTATSLNNLAVVLRCLDQLDAAEDMVRRALEINVSLYGMNHPETGNCLNNLAIIHSDRENFDTAESLYRWAIEIREECLGTDHPDLIINYRNMSKMYEAAGKTPQAEHYRKRYQRAMC